MKNPNQLLVAFCPKFVLTVAILVCAFLSPAHAGSGTLNGLTSDAFVTNGLAVGGITAAEADLGSNGTGQQDIVYVFQIPSSIVSDPTQQFSAATFTMRLDAIQTMSLNADLYGLDISSSSSVLASDYYEGTNDTANSLIQANFLTPTSPSGSTISNSNAALVSYLNSVLITARDDGISSPYVFFRLNCQGTVSAWCFYKVAMADYGFSPYVPTLSYTTVTVPVWSTVPLGGGGYITGLVGDAAGDVYARTDCGGALKWDPVGLVWNSITDNIVPPSSTGTLNTEPGSNNQLMSISSLAIDPSNTSNLYVSAGDYTYNHGGIFASGNKGATWTQINSTISMQGQGDAKACGERLAVDPNNSNIVWFGSISGGLYKGVNTSGTWAWTQIPSTSVHWGQGPSGDPAGVTFVACDANSGSTIVYAGVFDSSGSTGGVYMSSNGGTTWTKAGGITLGTPLRGQVAPNGTLYVTENGTVARMPRGGALAAITPPATGVNFCGLTIDTTDATGNTLYVAESNGNASDNRIFRTTNGGSAWTTQSTNFNSYVGGGAPAPASTEPDGTPSLTNSSWFEGISSLLINPTNNSELFAGTYFGADRTEDAQDLGSGASGSFWNTIQKNQEQTVVTCLFNATSGARLIVGDDDITGYQYLNTQFRPYGTYGTKLIKFPGGSTLGLDFCEGTPTTWARTWLSSTGTNTGSGGVSVDGGASWVEFGEVAEQNITNSGTAGWVTYDVTSYLAAQKAAGTNTVTLVLCCGNSISPLFSTNSVVFDSKENGASTAPNLLINSTSTLTDTGDALVYGGTTGTTTNYGSATNLVVSYNYNNAANNRWSYIQFDLSSVSSITSAILQLHRQAETYADEFPVGVYACPTGTTWSESTITWNTKPALLASSTDPIGSPFYNGSTHPCAGRIAISANNPNNLVWLPQGSTSVALYSKDRGVNWTASTGGPTSQALGRDTPSTLIQQLAADRVNGNFYLAKFGGGAGGTHAIYTSTTGGASWTQVSSTGPGDNNIYRAQLVAAPVAGDIWVCDDGTGHTPPVGGLWHSINGGTSWSQVGSGTISLVREVAFGKGTGGASYSVFFSGCLSGVKGVYRSDDTGSTWHALAGIPTNADITALAGDRQNYGIVFIGTDGRGVYQGQ